MSEVDIHKATPAVRGPKGELVSRALADAARKNRFTTKKSVKYRGGFAARRGQVAYKAFAIACFLCLFLIPALVGTLYFTVFASNQYVAEARFAVRSDETPRPDAIAGITGIPSLRVVQDTQVVTDYIQSRAIVEELDRMLAIKAHYSDPAFDWWARFDPSKPIERFVNYWSWRASTSIQMPSGIIVLQVRAFTPEMSASIANAVIRLSERLVNDTNERVRRDSVSAAERELERDSARLKDVRVALQAARNRERVLDTQVTARTVETLITGLEGERLKMQQEFNSQRRFVSADAPQMRNLRSRIDAISEQINALKDSLTRTTAPVAGQTATMAETMTTFSALQLDLQIAERQYAASLTTLETARFNSERQQLYLTTFIWPSAPEDSSYPRRWLYTFFVLVLAAAAWGVVFGLGTLLRNYMP